MKSGLRKPSLSKILAVRTSPSPIISKKSMANMEAKRLKNRHLSVPSQGLTTELGTIAIQAFTGLPYLN